MGKIIKKIKKFFAVSLFLFVIAASFMLLWISYNYVVPVVMYHHVDYLDHHEALYVSPENFEYQMG